MSSVTIRIPAVLQPFADGQSRLATEAATVDEALGKLCAIHEQLRPRLFAPDGQLRRFVNVYVNDDDVRFLDDLATATPAGTTISIIPAVAGG